MKLLELLLVAGTLLMGCKAYIPTTLNEPITYQVVEAKGDYRIMTDSIQAGELVWGHRRDSCIAWYRAGADILCFDKSKEARNVALIRSENHPDPVGKIEGIKRWESSVKLADGRELELDTKRGVLEMKLENRVIATYDYQRRKGRLQVLTEHNNDLILAAMLFKAQNLRSMDTSNNVAIWTALFVAF